MIALFWLGVLCLLLAAAAFISDIVVCWWERWDDLRRANRRADLQELKRVLGLET